MSSTRLSWEARDSSELLLMMFTKTSLLSDTAFLSVSKLLSTYKEVSQKTLLTY